MDMLNRLKGGLVVSCQPVDDGPMDDPRITAAMACAAEAGGAAGLRIEGVDNLAAVRPLTRLPIIGLIKRDLADSAVRITPWLDDVAALVEAGADIIAYDATQRPRPVETAALAAAITGAGRIAMADCARLADGEQARREGAAIIGTTLSGYAYEIAAPTAAPDLELIGQFAALGGFVMAEGRLNRPELARAAMAAGADCATVGSAITRIEHSTGWFAEAVKAGADERG